ncbi:hypothetical protein E4U46_005059 [Claviceps purpurea]|nr:hypothetical protein E4U28_005372 [Claviceps purpurea]KAG6286267.1 hypothetical protein E4U46_005059 [Claviceps purpurea]
MSSAARVWGACRALAVRTRPIAAHRSDSIFAAVAVLRTYSADTTNKPPVLPSNQSPTEPTSVKPAPSSRDDGTAPIVPVSEAEAFTEKESESADSSSSGFLDDDTLVQLMYGGKKPVTTGEEGLTTAQEEVLYRDGTILDPQEAETALSSDTAEEAEKVGEIGQATQLTTQTTLSFRERAARQLAERKAGHKFGLPPKPYAADYHLKKRYHPAMEQFTRLLMVDGKLSVAQSNVAMVMNFLRTAPAPIYSPKYPLLPGSPPASHLPLNPILYITLAIDSVAPLLSIRNIAGAGGGGRALELPSPLNVRQRRRLAIQWILDVVDKKPSKGSGRKQFPHRIADEIIAVVEGRSTVWEKRRQVHKVATAARANINSRKMGKKKK